MQRLLAIALGLGLGIVQTVLRGWGAEVVIPNIALVIIVAISNRLELGLLGAVALACGVVLELSSAAPLGTELLGTLLVVLVAKLLLRGAVAEHRFWYLFWLSCSAALGYNLVLGFTIPFDTLQAQWGVMLSRVGLELLYNSVIFGFAMAILTRRQPADGQYRLPNS